MRSHACLLAVVSACAGANEPPLIAPVGPLSVTVGDTLDVPLRARDPEGSSVRFEVRGAPEGAEVVEDASGARFVYSPLASDARPGGALYPLTVVASDADGASSALSTSLTVWPEGSVPEFLGPFAWTLNLAVDDHVLIPVRVKDNDTARLDIRLIQGPPGAVLDVRDGHSASLFFKPRPAQVATGVVFTFVLGASDRDHPEVTGEYVVLLINPDLFGGCPGTPPVAWHDPPGKVQGKAATIRLYATDTESSIRSATLFFSALGPAPDSFNALPMAPGEAFEAEIPDLSAAAIAGRLIFYHFEVSDSDDPLAACNHVVRLPKVGEYALVMYKAGHVGCLEDTLCDHCDQDSPAQLPTSAVPGLRLCGQPDVFKTSLNPLESLAVLARPMSSLAPPLVEVLDKTGKVLASGPSSVIASAEGEVLVQIVPTEETELTYELSSLLFQGTCETSQPSSYLSEGKSDGRLCPGESHRYHLSLGASEAALVTLSYDTSVADLDMLVTDPDGFPVAASAGAVGGEQVMIQADEATLFTLTVSAVGLGSAEYSLYVSISANHCTDDLLWPNGTLKQAPLVPEGTYEHLKLCPGTTDFVRLGLNGGEDLTVVVSAQDDPPPLALLADAGTPLATGQVAGAERILDLTIPGPGDYTIQVGPAQSDRTVSYTLAFSATDPPGACRPDRLEPNDDSPASIPDGFTTHLTLCQGDRDLFSFRLAALETFSAWLLDGSTKPHGVLLSQDGTVVAVGAPASFGEELFFVAKDNGQYVLSLESADGEGWYDVGISRD